ncbi:MAG: hypothetical protein WD529_07275 [Balneolaceae bacterium]
MDDLNTMTAQALSNLNIKGIQIAEPYGRLIGEPEMNAVYFIWGEKGAGKSTFSLGLADALAEHGRVEYIPAEEHFGKTLVDKVKRLDARHNNLNFTKWKSIDSLKEVLQANQSSFCVLDSISVIDANDKATVEFAQWCREAGIGFVMVAHANKDGRYKGNTSIAHECDVEIKVTAEGMAETEKNRYEKLTEIEVPFTSKDRQVVRSNSTVKALTKKQYEWVEDQLSNDESSSDDEMVEFFREEIGLTAGQAKHWVTKRDAYLTDPIHSEGRENPVDVPFRIKLAEIDKIHKFRSWRRINSLMGSKMPCYAKKHSGESETPHFSIRYTPDYNKKKYVVDLLLDGRLEAQICTEGTKGGFKASWNKLVAGYGDIEVMIFSQDHAKKVLGAKEYKKQERRFKKTQKTAGKPKKQPWKGKRFSLPESHEKYFKMQEGAENVPLNRVVLGRKPKEAACDRALGHMKKASGGAIQKRHPVTVYKEGGKYIVVDGNCTTTVARRSGWKKLPVTIVSKKSGQSELEKKSKKPATKSNMKKSGTNKKAGKVDSIDIEAAKKSQSKLDAFLEKVLS